MSKRTKGLFTEIVKKSDGEEPWKALLKDLMKDGPSPEVRRQFSNLAQDFEKLTKVYDEMLQSENVKEMLGSLSSIETKMLQLHCFFDAPLTFGTQIQTRNRERTEYILVRAPFHFPTDQRQEIRIYLGKISDHKGKTLKELEKDEKFVYEAKQKIQHVMLEQIKGHTNDK